MEIEGAFQYKKVDFLQVGAENDAYNPKISVSMLYWKAIFCCFSLLVSADITLVDRYFADSFWMYFGYQIRNAML